MQFTFVQLVCYRDLQIQVDDIITYISTPWIKTYGSLICFMFISPLNSTEGITNKRPESGYGRG